MLQSFKYIVVALILLIFGCSTSLKATHLIGGNLGYKYIGPHPTNPSLVEYKIEFTTYIDCNSVNWGTAFPEPIFNIGIYSGAINPTSSMPLAEEVTVTLTDSAQIDPALPPGCNFGSSTCIYLVYYEGTVYLPLSSTGYHLIYERCCRPAGIVNLTLSGDQAMSFQAYIPPNNTGLPTEVNNAPTFTDTLVSYICIGDTTFIANTATDPDGDSLVYSIEQPYWGYTNNTSGNVAMTPSIAPWNPYTYPPPLITWGGGASMVDPFGPGGDVSIDNSTGLTSFYAPTAGIYVIAVEIKEYRNGVLIGRTRRDIQLLSVNCPSNPRPTIASIASHPNAINQNTIEIMAGDSVCIDLNASDQNNNVITMSANGSIFDPNQTNPPATFTANPGSPGSGSGTFCWHTSCDQDRPQPYSFTIQATDDGCPPKIDVDAFNVMVIPYQGPDSLMGPDSICFGNHLGVQYTVPEAHKYISYSWSVTGGTILGSNTDSVITVDWNVNTQGQIAIDVVSWSGCVSSTLITPVYVGFDFEVDAGTDTINCYNDTITVGTANDPSLTYTWTPSSNFITPNQGISDYVVLQSATLTLMGMDVAGCYDTSEVFVDMYPPIGNVYITGEDTICYGDQNNNVYEAPFGNAFFYDWNVIGGTIIGQPASNMATVNWNTPAYGEVSVQISDTFGCETPTFYYNVRVGDQIPVNAGNDTAACRFETVNIGAGTSNPDYTYSWNPLAGLSNANVLETDVIVDGTTMYVLTVMDSLNCTNVDSVLVEQYPDFEVDITSPDVYCEGETLQLYATDAVYYSWTPANEVSDASIQNPYAFPDSTTTYEVYAVDQNGCDDSDSITVTVQPYPEFWLYYDTAIFLGQTGGAQVYSNMSNLIFQWSPPNGLSCTTCLNPDMNPEYTTTYTLNVSDPNGCFSIDTLIEVIVHRDYAYHIPNAFSPNGDGLNEEALVYTWGIKRIKEFSIFNRWGEMVFTTDKFNVGWNGVYKGVLQPGQTVFAYRVVLERFTGDEIQEYGKIVLVR